MHTRLAFVVGTCLLLAGNLALARAEHGAGMKRLDLDQNQQLSVEEAALSPRLAQQFPLIDSNHDGQLDRAELKAYAAQRRALHEDAMTRRFALLDANQDGVLAGEEVEGKRRLARLDANEDGRIELAEFNDRQRQRHAGKRCRG